MDVDYSHRHLLEPLLTSIMQRDYQEASPQSALGSALVAALAALVSPFSLKDLTILLFHRPDGVVKL